MKVVLDPGAFLPERAHQTDAGMDLRSPVDVVIPSSRVKSAISGYKVEIGSVSIDTGVHIQLPHGTYGSLKSKSGLNVKHGITSEGVIDEGYTGSIVVKLYNHSDEPYPIRKGDKITQLIVQPCVYEPVDLVDDMEETERGSDGFGSTGR